MIVPPEVVSDKDEANRFISCVILSSHFCKILKNLNWNDIFFIAKNNKKRINEFLSVPRTDRKMMMIFYDSVENIFKEIHCRMAKK